MIEILSDSIGLIGVLIGGLIAAVVPWIREARQEKRLRADRANYLAARVINILDAYAGRCVEVVNQKTIIEKENNLGRRHIFSVPPFSELPPMPEFPDDVDWKSINSKLVYKIFKLRNSIQIANNITKYREGEVTAPLSGYLYLHEARWYEYSRVGLTAVEIISELVEKYRTLAGDEVVAGALKQRQIFSDMIMEIEESRKIRPGWEEEFEQESLKALIRYRESGNPMPQMNKGEGE